MFNQEHRQQCLKVITPVRDGADRPPAEGYCGTEKYKNSQPCSEMPEPCQRGSSSSTLGVWIGTEVVSYGEPEGPESVHKCWDDQGRPAAGQASLALIHLYLEQVTQRPWLLLRRQSHPGSITLVEAQLSLQLTNIIRSTLPPQSPSLPPWIRISQIKKLYSQIKRESWYLHIQQGKAAEEPRSSLKMQVQNSPCPWPTLLGCTEEFQTPQPHPANNFRSIPSPTNQDSHPTSSCHLPQDWRKGHSFPRREVVWGGEAAPSGQGPWLRKQTPTDPTQLGRMSQGLEIAWSCCFFYKMVGEQFRFERQQNPISKPRSATDMLCNSRQVNILLWAWFLICKLEIYVSKWLTAFTQSFRKYLLNSY